MLNGSVKTALTIAGSDSSGGAGIQADIKTFSAFGIYGMSVITAVTAQNTCGVYGIQNVSDDIIQKQMDAVFKDIPPNAVKIGMTSSASIIEVIADRLKFYEAKNIVLDPVMISTSGSRLLNADAISILQKKLFPLASLITPNIPEAEVLSGLNVCNKKDMEQAALKIYEQSGSNVLLKGGHCTSDSCDFFFNGKNGVWFKAEKINNPNTHGTGCTLSSAICANLALEKSLEDSIHCAKEYINGALKAMLDLGKGSGPLNHLWNLQTE